MPISPGVYTKIIDLSYYLQEVPGTTGFVCFFSKRGPDNKLYLSSGQVNFKEIFDTPNINDFGKLYGQGPYIAWNHLAMSGSLYCMRLLPDDDTPDSNQPSGYATPATFSNLFVNYNTDATGSIEITHKSPPTGITSLKTDIEKNAQMVAVGNLEPMILFYPIGRGDSYNDFGITMEPHSNPILEEQGVYILNIYEKSPSQPQDNITESFEVSFNENDIDDAGDSIYITEVVNRFSKNIKCWINDEHLNNWKKTDIQIIIEHPFATQEYPIGSGIEISSSAIHLNGGSEGSLVAIDPDTGRRIVNNSVAKSLLYLAYSGQVDYDVQDLDNIYFSVVYDAGYPDEGKDGIRYLCEDLRRDCFGFTDNGDNVDVTASIANRNTAPIMNTFYIGIYEPFNKLFDAHTGKDIWVSPIYHLSNIIPKNDSLYHVWYPSAGYNRGTIPTIKEMRFNPRLSERDQLYLAQINPIVKFNVGYTIWGNLTSQKRPSKMSNVSTVRTVLYIKRALEQFCKWFIFEFNDADTHSAIASEIAGFLQTVQDARALEGYSIEVGATEYEKKQKICHVNVTLIPVGIIERINLNLYIQ